VTQNENGRRQGGLLKKIAEKLFGSPVLASENELIAAERKEQEMKQRLRDAHSEARSWLRRA
jgi:hypothetical protein